ncbi:MAG: serine protease [Planctomycetes bacterium]|nr:serine protease [Planctomycetota bacterium]
MRTALLALALLAPGCLQASLAERVASLEPLGPDEGRRLREHLAARTSLVLVRGRGAAGPWRHHGTAAAVTSDGYLLTCAHVVREGRVEVVEVDGRADPAQAEALFDLARPRRARVVWLPVRPGEDDPDLALLHVEGLALEPFDLAPLEAAAGATDVLCAGFPRGLRGHVGLGRVLETTRLPPARPGQPAVLEVRHSVPLAGGDSGGPLVDLRTGALVGVNSGVTWDVVAGRRARALLPDPAWLQARIEADRRSRAGR